MRSDEDLKGNRKIVAGAIDESLRVGRKMKNVPGGIGGGSGSLTNRRE